MKINIFLALAIIVLANTTNIFSQTQISIIPQPVSVTVNEGTFTIDQNTKIIADETNCRLAFMLSKILSTPTGYKIAVTNDNSVKQNRINLILSDSDNIPSEGYILTSTAKAITIKASDLPGMFYGIQTLRQLLPEQIFSERTVKDVKWSVPCVNIEDYPNFKWRGMHLDVCRHFFDVEFVKKYIDLLALHKMNTFHWHLTEDQGWRIEIKKYPKLTQIGSIRKQSLIGHNDSKNHKYDNTPHGGYYTQDQILEVIQYAKDRFINIVPEIEMPGHSVAALAAYPEYSCTGGPFETRTLWGISDDVYCVGNDETIKFLQDILTEVLDLFPSEFIHIGGDECPKTKWSECPKCQAKIKQLGLKDEHELQSWFIKQMDTFLAERGRRLIGWDEILEGGLAPGATVMSWRGETGGINAAKAGHDVIMAPNSHTYFDHYQADKTKEPLAIGGFLPIEKVYSYNPTPEALTPEQSKHILGVQAQVWTEYIPTPEHAEYMAYPRACALSEVAWTPVENKNYDNFLTRLSIHTKRLKTLNVNFRPLDK